MSGPLFDLLGSILIILVGGGFAYCGYRFTESKDALEYGIPLTVFGGFLVLFGIVFTAATWDVYAHTLGGFPKRLPAG